jgi:hypothetical protein
LKKLMQLKIGDWQIYTILLAFVSCASPYMSYVANQIQRDKSSQPTPTRST